MKPNQIPALLGSLLPNLPAHSQTPEPLPQRAGESFVIEDWNGKCTLTDLGHNHAGGNEGTVGVPTAGVAAISLVDDRTAGGKGKALRLTANFAGAPSNALAGLFVFLQGLSDTLVSLDGSTPSTTTQFPGYVANFNDYFKGFAPFAGRSIDDVLLGVRLAPGSAPLRVKFELRDTGGRDVFARFDLTSSTWSDLRISRTQFSGSVTSTPAAFDWANVDQFSILIEKFVSGEVSNSSGAIEIDDFRLQDADGMYPDLAAIGNPDGSLQPRYRTSFLQHILRLSSLYFRDFASTDPRTGHMVGDRSTFADLMTVGGVPYQVAALITAAERGEVPEVESRAGALALLRVLANGPQGPQATGRTGFRGFWYHFLGIDGRRKQNFDFLATSGVNEALNTVELSLIDTTLAAAGVTIVREYWTGDHPDEVEIRSLADTILGRIEWPFMLRTVGGKEQFALGWKPLESRDDSGPNGRFLLPDGAGTGHYNSKLEGGVEVVASLDFYTTEGQLAALLAMACPNPANRLSPEVWHGMIRSGTPFVKTFPGSIFTYSWLDLFVDTERMGTDSHPTRPVNWHTNTADAIAAARAYAAANPNGMASLAPGWTGIQPCEGPFDTYSAHAFPTVSLADAPPGHLRFECEQATGPGTNMPRSNASNQGTRWLTLAGSSITWSYNLPATLPLRAFVEWSNDGPADMLTLSSGAQTLGSFTTFSTGSGGSGWNVFARSSLLTPVSVAAGAHTLSLTVNSTDQFGVEPDVVRLIGPVEDGVFTLYGVVEQLPWAATASDELYRLVRHDLYDDGKPPLLHPRFGMADAFDKEISEALVAVGLTGAEADILRNTGPWHSITGFAIDHGPVVMALCNLLHRDLLRSLFTRNPGVSTALASVFPAARSPFAQWRLDRIGSLSSPAAAPDADPDKDGRTNAAEYARGSDPLQPDAESISITSSGGQLRVQLTVDIRAAASLTAETSDDLGTWTPSASPPRLVARLGDGLTRLEWTLPATGPRRWVRVRFVL